MTDPGAPRPRVVTLGCRLNALESEIMAEAALGAGLDDAIIVNTCAVTAEAERQGRQTIRRLARENPGARIVVTGCAAQLDPDAYIAIDGVSRVVGNSGKLDGRLLAGGDGAAVSVSDIMAEPETVDHPFEVPMIAGFAERTRAFVQVQQGCDHRCTFCIIPFARGPNRSVAPARIVEQVRRMARGGHAEVVLTGVDVSSYGADDAALPPLGVLAETILGAVPELKRLRITSLDPANIDDAIFRLLAEEPRFMPHLHLSLQSGDDMILKRMKRRHTRAMAEAVVARARRARPDVAIGVDLIAGFPTETEDMFEGTLAAVADFGLAYLHVFPYSRRPGTPAAKMPGLPGGVVKERARRLREAGRRALGEYLAGAVGGLVEVLIEKPGLGHSRHFQPVELASNGGAALAAPGAIVEARVLSVGPAGDKLIADLAA